MSVVSKATLKTYFEDGKEPDENKFIDLIDSMALVSGVPGNFTIGDGTGGKSLTIDGASGNVRDFLIQSGGNNRWILRVNSASESGGNVGSDIELIARKDDGTYLSTPLKIIRSTGAVRINQGLSVGGADDPGAGKIYTTDDIHSGGGLVVYGGVSGYSSRTGGMELEYDSGWSDILSYDRNAATRRPLRIRASALELNIDGDVYTVPWTSYAGISTITGWASFSTKHLKYKKVGKTVFVQFWLDGVSGGTDGTVATFTLPFTVSANASISTVLRIMNNGTYAVGTLTMGSGGSQVSIYPQIAGGNWIASGTKRALGEFWYQIA
jgi:hypothetical protein